MKHCCHCGFHTYRSKLKAKKLGALGVLLVVLHLLWHVAECLILPAIFMTASSATSLETKRDKTISTVEMLDSSDITNLDHGNILEYPFAFSLTNATVLDESDL